MYRWIPLEVNQLCGQILVLKSPDLVVFFVIHSLITEATESLPTSNGMEKIDILFGDALKVKLMKLFIFNKDEHFELKDIVSRVKSVKDRVRKNINVFEKAKLVKRVSFLKETRTNRGKVLSFKKKKAIGYKLNEEFQFLIALQNLLIDVGPRVHGHFVKRLKKAGRIKAIVVSGVFLQDLDSRLDVLIVGDKLKRGFIDNAVKTMEAEIGKELRYMVLDTNDFHYRMSVCDRLIRDVFDFPHKKVFDSIGIHYN